MDNTETTKREPKLLNASILSLKHKPELDIHVTGPFEMMHAPKLFDTDDGMGEVLPVIDLATGEIATLMAYAVVKSTLEKVEGGYVGKDFRIISTPMADGDKYRRLKVYAL